MAITAGATLIATPTLPWEVGNALIALLRRRRLDAASVRAAWRNFESVPMRVVDVDIGDALEVAIAAGVYACDACVIEAAKGQRIPLLTLDRRMATLAASLGVAVLEIGP